MKLEDAYKVADIVYEIKKHQTAINVIESISTLCLGNYVITDITVETFDHKDFSIKEFKINGFPIGIGLLDTGRQSLLE